MEHEFAIQITLPLTKKDAFDLMANRRKTFRKVDPFSNDVISSVVGCNVCHKPAGYCFNNPECEGPPETEETLPDIPEEAQWT